MLIPPPIRRPEDAPPFPKILILTKQDGDKQVWNRILPIFEGLDFQIRRSTSLPIRQLAEAIKTSVLPNIHPLPKAFARLRVRDLFTYALVLCEYAQYQKNEATNTQPSRQEALLNEAKESLDRLAIIFELIRKMQFPDGHFKWFWQDTKNHKYAVDFCMRSAALISLRHQQLLKNHNPQLWRRLLNIIEKAMPASQRRVPEKFTNIALMNALSLILLGETLNWPSIAQKGHDRLESIYLYTWEWGIHEYTSPTYTGIQANNVGLIRQYSTRSASQEQAEQIFELLTCIGARNFSIQGRDIIGTRSRRLSNYFKGDARIRETLWVFGLNTIPQAPLPMRTIYPALVMHPKLQANTFPYDILKKYVDKRINDWQTPFLARESWGPLERESRTTYIKKGVCLSSVNASYDFPKGQDLPLEGEIFGQKKPQSNTDLKKCIKTIAEHADKITCYIQKSLKQKNKSELSCCQTTVTTPSKSKTYSKLKEELKKALKNSKQENLIKILQETLQKSGMADINSDKCNDLALCLLKQYCPKFFDENDPHCENTKTALPQDAIILQLLWCNLFGDTHLFNDDVFGDLQHHLKQIFKDENISTSNCADLCLTFMIELFCDGDQSKLFKAITEQAAKNNIDQWCLIALILFLCLLFSNKDYYKDLEEYTAYFISDINNDPYSNSDYHHTPLFWTAAQNKQDALGLAIYKPQQRKRLDSHFILPIKVEKILVVNDAGVEDLMASGTLRGTDGAAFKNDTPNDFTFKKPEDRFRYEKTIEIGDAVVLVTDDAVLGVKIIWASSLKGTTPPIELAFDNFEDKRNKNKNGDPIPSLRLTVHHHLLKTESAKRNPWTQAGVALWVKIDNDVANAGDWAKCFHKKQYGSIPMDRYKCWLESQQKTKNKKSSKANKEKQKEIKEFKDMCFDKLLETSHCRCKDKCKDHCKCKKEYNCTNPCEKPDQKCQLIIPEYHHNEDKNPKSKRLIRNLTFQVDAQCAPLGISVYSPNGKRFITDLLPAPTQAILEDATSDQGVIPVDERTDLGRQILGETSDRGKNGQWIGNQSHPISFIKSYNDALTNTPQIQVPVVDPPSVQNQNKSIIFAEWPATDGRITPPVQIGKGTGITGRQYLWIPSKRGRIQGSDVGNATWRFTAEQTDCYYLWGHILTPQMRNNAFHVRLYEVAEHRPYLRYVSLAPWYSGLHNTWTWVPLDLSEAGNSASTTALHLYAEKEYALQIFFRKAGAKLDRLFITNQQDLLPNQMPIAKTTHKSRKRRKQSRS